MYVILEITPIFFDKIRERLYGTWDRGRFPVPRRKRQLNHTVTARGADHSPHWGTWDMGQSPVPENQEVVDAIAKELRFLGEIK